MDRKQLRWMCCHLETRGHAVRFKYYLLMLAESDVLSGSFHLVQYMRYIRQSPPFPQEDIFTITPACTSRSFRDILTQKLDIPQLIREWIMHWRHCAVWSSPFHFCHLGYVRYKILLHLTVSLTVSKELYERAILSLCVMATKPQQYRAMGSSSMSVEDTETAEPCEDISLILMQYFGITKRKRSGDVLYFGDQFKPGKKIDRISMLEALKEVLNI